MKEVDRIRLENTIQLGSLEDIVPVKRLEPNQIRRMRALTHEQTTLKFSMRRYIAVSWKNLRDSISTLLSKPKKECADTGHVPFYAYGGDVKCRYCGVKMHASEQAVHIE